MMFSPLEIFLCLLPFMLIIFTIGLGLVAQNVSLARRERERDSKHCPRCQGLLNPEAYVCRHCRKELYEYEPAKT